MGKSLMGQVNRKSSQAVDGEFSQGTPSPPRYCQTQGCSNDASHVMARVANGRGIQHKPASDVMNIDRFGGHLKLTMLDGYQFIGWWAKCPNCYKEAFERGRAKLRMDGEHPFYV